MAGVLGRQALGEGAQGDGQDGQRGDDDAGDDDGGADAHLAGHHTAVVANVPPGNRAAVVGDGAVGLCAVIAAKRLGAEQIIILGRHVGHAMVVDGGQTA